MPGPTPSYRAAPEKPLSKKGSKGFTLIELLLVMLIIGILASISIATYSTYVDKAQRTVAISTLDLVRKTLEAYNIEYQSYPPSINIVTGDDGLGNTVFSSLLLDQINGDVLWNNTYVRGAGTYSLTVRARDKAQTTMTLTPEAITY